MQDFTETLLHTVAAMSAASFGYFGVTLKDDQTRVSRPEPAVVRRIPAPAAPRREMVIRPARAQDRADCPDAQLVKT